MPDGALLAIPKPAVLLAKLKGAEGEAVGLLGNAVLATRQNADMSRAIATRALWTLARLGRAGRAD